MTGAGPEPGATSKLPVDQLAARLDRILAAGERLIRAVPEAVMDREVASDGETLRDAAHGLFRVGLAFADAMDTGHLRASWLAERAPSDLRDGAAVARYAALVRGRLGGWFEGAGAGEYTRLIEADGGARSGRELLERIVARAARRLERLHAELSALGLRADESRPRAGVDDGPLSERRAE